MSTVMKSSATTNATIPLLEIVYTQKKKCVHTHMVDDNHDDDACVNSVNGHGSDRDEVGDHIGVLPANGGKQETTAMLFRNWLHFYFCKLKSPFFPKSHNSTALNLRC